MGKNKSILQATSSLNAWLSYLEKLHNKSIDMSLERINKVAERLDILKPASFIFTVAGTNGKGTTCSILESILIASGYRVGVYNSPHLIHYNERIRVQSSELSDFKHTNSFAAIESVRENIPLTYFEYSTLSALWLFKQEKLDVIILEVGLGGRLDATNIINTDIAIITNIALDHSDWLGSDRESIAYEKAGIFRTGKPAIIGELDIPNIIIQIAKKKMVNLLRIDIDWNFFLSEKSWCYVDKYGKIEKLPFPRVPQPNAATALAALRASPFKVHEKAIRKGIQNAFLPGRFQIISKAPLIILDVGHNPHATAYLAARLKSIQKNNRRVLAVVGMLCDKDIAGTLAHMESIVDKWYCASLKEPRGSNAEQLVSFLNKGKIYENVVQAWHAATTDVYPEDILLVFGSFYTVANVMKIIDIGKIDSKEVSY